MIKSLKWLNTVCTSQVLNGVIILHLQFNTAQFVYHGVRYRSVLCVAYFYY